MNLVDLEKKIGYAFKDVKLLEEALTHSSYSNERRKESRSNNERLEFLGDSVLGIVISDYLFKNFQEMPEGELTKVRSKIVCETTLGECSRAIDLGAYMFFGKGEEMTGGRDRTSILADAYESLIASIYMDGGLEASRDFILTHMKKKISDAIAGKVFLDYKTHLQELVQVNKSNKIKYEIIGEEGPDHCKVFHTQVSLNELVIGDGVGRSKKESEQEAAKMALRKVEALDLVGCCIPSRKDQHGNVLAALAQFFKNIQTGPAGHHDVENDQVRPVVKSHSHAFLTIGGHKNLVAVQPQVHDQPITQGPVIFDNEDYVLSAAMVG